MADLCAMFDRQLSEAKSYLQREMSMLNTSGMELDDVICLDDSLDENSIFFFVQYNAELQKHRMGRVMSYSYCMTGLYINLFLFGQAAVKFTFSDTIFAFPEKFVISTQN